MAYAQHLDAVMAEQNSLKVNSKMARVDAIQAEREQVLATMGRLRQEMSLQEDIYRQTLHNMKVGCHLVDCAGAFSVAMSSASLHGSRGAPPVAEKLPPDSSPWVLRFVRLIRPYTVGLHLSLHLLPWPAVHLLLSPSERRKGFWRQTLGGHICLEV